MPEAFIAAATRSPIGRAFEGSLIGVPALDPSALDDLCLGCGEPDDEQGASMARRVAVRLGPDSVPGATITRFCASSLQTTRIAFHAIKAGERHAFVSAGVECVSRYGDPADRSRVPDPVAVRTPGVFRQWCR